MSERENRPSRPGPEWIATAAAIAAGTAAYGDIVSYDNPDGAGHFWWMLSVLDVTAAPGDQPGSLGDPTTSFQDYFSDFYPTFSYETTYQSGGGMQIFSRGFANHYAAPLDAGTLVGPGLGDGSFNSGTVFEFSFFACTIEYVYDPDCQCYYYKYDCESGERGIIPEGVETYLGVRFDVGNGPQYGWVKVIRNWVEIDALAWGFETEPGVPIAAGDTGACPGDLNGDDVVNVGDLLQLLQGWGTAAGDVNGDGTTNVIDLVQLLAAWGPCDQPLASSAGPPTGTLAALAFGCPRAEVTS